MNIKELVLEYFDAFENKNLDRLEIMFAENISLQDWEISAKGKKEVINANKKIFSFVESISISPIKIYQDERTVIAELKILLNSNESFSVMDVIDFDEKGKISAIKAYKR